MDGDRQFGVRPGDPRDPAAQEDNLDRALVTGLMLEVILETSSGAVDPQTLPRLVKARLKDSLVVNLAGRVTLARFRHLLHKVDLWFPLYYPLAAPAGSIKPLPSAAARVEATPALPPAPPAPPEVLREDRLRAWLREEARDLLPRRSHRKLSRGRLWEFLSHTRGGWFRLKDFERHFGVDRKTAWEYLRKLLHAGLLRHNRKHSAAVRYALAAHFLLVRAEALESRIAVALADLSPKLAEEVSAWLLATGGQAFWEKDWHGRLEPHRCRQLLDRLQDAGLLAELCQAGDDRMLQLAPPWLQE